MKANLLNEWFKEYRYLSSDLHPWGRIYRRKDIEWVVGVLSSYFGNDFFVVPTENTSAKTIESSNWIHNLLVLHRPSSILALFEICNLLVYLQKQDEKLQKQMRSTIRHIHKFQDLFFEVYVYRILEFNRIPVEKKAMKGNQELEGRCEINGKKYLFECKKPTFIYMPELEAFVQIIQEFRINFSKLQNGKELVGYVQLKKDPKQAKNEAVQKIKKFAKNPKSFAGTIDFHYESEFVKIRIENYDEVKYIEYTTQDLQPRVIFKILPPIVVVPDTENLYRFFIEYDFSAEHNKIIDKLLDALDKKRKQHSESKREGRIFFFDNEHLGDFKLPLLPISGIENDEKIMEYLNTKETEDILCIMDRNFLSSPPKIGIKVYCKDESEEVKKVLEGLKTNFGYKLRQG